MKKHNNFSLHFFQFSALLFLFMFVNSCTKHKWDNEVSKIVLPFEGYGKLYTALVDNNGIIYFAGGERLDRNDIFQSKDNGASWQLFHYFEEEYTNKAIFSLVNVGDTIFASSFDGKVLRNTSGQYNQWELGMASAWWYTFSNLAADKNGNLYAAGNNNYSKGLIVKFDTDFTTQKVDSFPFAINDIAFLNQQIGYAVGYGAVLKTENGGYSWQQLNLTDDNYRSVFIIDKDNVWTVGFNGTIAHITQNGNKFEKIKNGQSPFSNTDRFLAVKFEGNTGFIIGEKGVVLHSTDAGLHWTRMKKFTNEDLYAVAFNPFLKEVYFVGNNYAAYKTKY